MLHCHVSVKQSLSTCVVVQVDWLHYLTVQQYNEGWKFVPYPPLSTVLKQSIRHRLQVASEAPNQSLTGRLLNFLNPDIGIGSRSLWR